MRSVIESIDDEIMRVSEARVLTAANHTDSRTASAGTPVRWDQPTIGETLMSASCHTPRLTRFAILAVTGATALSIAACGSSNNSSPTSTSTLTSTSTAAPRRPRRRRRPSRRSASQRPDRIGGGQRGSGDPQNDKTATPPWTSPVDQGHRGHSGRADRRHHGQLRHRAAPRKGPRAGRPITAASVRVSPSVDGTCPKRKGPQAGFSTRRLRITDAGPRSDAGPGLGGFCRG